MLVFNFNFRSQRKTFSRYRSSNSLIL